MTLGRLNRLIEIAGPVSRETFNLLEAFEDLFLKWNKRINLSSSSTLEVWDRHILDSAQLAKIAPVTKTWVDLGSGGGFPGLVLAILIRDRPGAEIALVESSRKKASFLQTVTGQFNLPARVVAQRIENSHALVPHAEIVTARALAPLPYLLTLASPWLGKGARALMHKGRDYHAEVDEALHRWSFDMIEHPSMTDPKGVVLEVSNLRSRQRD